MELRQSNHPVELYPQSPAIGPQTIQQLKQWDKAHVWHPFSQMKDYVAQDPMVISHADGAYLYDVEGNRYFDGNSSLWVNVHGHNHPAINQAVKDQVDQIAHSTMLGQTNIPAVELAKRLVDVSPQGLTKVFYSDNGSTAMEVAVKMAFQYWQQASPAQPNRTSFLTFENAYHGDTLGSVSVSGIDLFHSVFGPMLFQRHQVPYPVYSKYTSTETPEQINARVLEQCEQVLKSHAHEIAGVTIEPLIEGATGMKTQSPGFLRGLRALCDEYNVFLIADEVFTGFGRTGCMFACDHEGVSPDFLALAKGLTGGYMPLAATLTTDQVYNGFWGDYEEFKTFFHGHSYTGNQLGSAAALVNVNLFEQDDRLNAIQPLIQKMETRLDRLFEHSDHVGDIHQIGLIAGIDLVKSRTNNQPYRIEDQIGAQVCLNLRKHGIWLRPLTNTLVCVPPLISTQQELDHLFDAIESCLDETAVRHINS